jgi:predicted nucleic acid-binding protein
MSRLKQRYAIFKSMEDDLIKMRVRNVSRAKLLGDMSPEVQNAAKMIAEQVKRVRKARELFDVTKNERDAALLNIKREGKARAALFSGDEKGMVQFSEFMGIFMRKGDPKILTDGIEDLLGPAHPWLRVANKLAGTIKYTSATLDLAGPFTHGLMMLPTNPIRWAKAAWHSTWALMDPTVQSHFIRDNIDVIRRMARAGVPIGDVEYFQAAKPGGGIAWGAPLSKVKAGPVNGEFLRSLANGLIGNTLGRFQAAYNADVLIMRTELWKAMEPYFYNERRRGGDAELASAVANTTGGIDIKALGAGPNHRAIEGMMIAFAPRLMRSVATIFADAFRAIPTETGFRLGFKEEGATAKQMQALKSLTSVVTFMHGFAGSAWIANEYSKKLQNPKGHTINWEKGYTELFNPLSGRRYMSIEVDGEWYGIGGQTRGMLQLLTGMFMAMNPLDESDKSFVSWDSQKNPWLQRLVTLGAPGLDASQAILEAATGADLVPGEEIDSPIDVIRHVSSNALMFAIQGKLEGDNLWGVMGSSIGFNTKPSTPFENGMNLRRDVFENMSLAEKAEFADKDGNYLRTWPGTTHGDAWENMDLRLKEYIDAQDENIGVFLEEHRKRRLEAGDEDQKYFSLRDEIIGERDSALEGVEEKYGVGEEYRLRMSSIYADTKSRLRQLDLDFDEVVGGLEVSDRKSEAEYNKAELKFWDAMGELDADGKSVFIDPDTKEYNYSLDRQVRKRLEADPLVGPYLDQIDERLRSMHPLGVRDFWEDMERMKDYFVMGETVAQEMGLRSEYMVWLGQGKDNRRALEGRDMALAALVRPGGNIDQVKQKMRRGADEARGWSADDALLLESALLKWEYVEKAQNPRLRYLWTKMLVDQGNWVHKREAIDQYVEDAIAEQRGALEPAAR